MPIHVDCPVCGQRLRVPNFAAGRFTMCTACGNGLRVPRPNTLLDEGKDDDRDTQNDHGRAVLAPSQLVPWSLEKLSAFAEWLTDRPLRAGVAGLIVVAVWLGAAGAKWALSKPVEETIAPVEPEDPEPWENVGASDSNDRVRVTAQSATTEQIEIVGLNVDAVRKTPRAYLRIALKIDNLSPEGLKYTGWSLASGNNDHAATLKDDAGASHNQVSWEAQIVGQTRSATIKPAESLVDILVFDAPRTYAKYLKLTLPAEACGGTGALRIKIPRTRAPD